ncbi:hypothetical protein SUGI_0962460 [Cryptomeria japonica]|nr:hypothetical protein SUGI_0962460 [Cryptomeria japonica]
MAVITTTPVEEPFNLPARDLPSPDYGLVTPTGEGGGGLEPATTAPARRGGDGGHDPAMAVITTTPVEDPINLPARDLPSPDYGSLGEEREAKGADAAASQFSAI